MVEPIYPCLWFDGLAAEAGQFYVDALGDGKIISKNPTVTLISLSGQKFMFLNGGPMFKPNPSISFFVDCASESEIDALWEKMVGGGKVLMALNHYPWAEKYGWLQDKYGVSWQFMWAKPGAMPQKYTAALMFTGAQAGKAEEAIGFYTSVFRPSSIKAMARYEPGEPDVTGTLKHAQFFLGAEGFVAMDSSRNHDFSFSEGISLVIICKDQQEIDYYWEKLCSGGGSEGRCGWLKDKYGVSWQVVPAVLPSLMSNPSKAGKVVEAFMKMNKFDISELEKAAS